MRADGWNRMQSLRRLTAAILGVLLAVLLDARAEIVTIATWNLECFPGGKPNSSPSERWVHMSAEISNAGGQRGDTCVAGQVESNHGNVGMNGLRPEQNGFCLVSFRRA